MDEEKRSRIAERIRQIRREHALTQEQAAARAGVTVRAWQRWEYGEVEPYASNIDALAREFGFSPAEFYEPAGTGTLEARLTAMETTLAEILTAIRPLGPFDADDEPTAPSAPATPNPQAAGRRRKTA